MHPQNPIHCKYDPVRTLRLMKGRDFGPEQVEATRETAAMLTEDPAQRHQTIPA
jgi:hypothetical protein